MALGVSLPALFRASAAEGPAPCLFLSGAPVSPAPEVRGWCMAGSSREADSTGCVHTERDWLTQLWRHKSESAGQVSRPQPREEPQAEPRARPLAGFLLAWWGEEGQSLFDPSRRLVGGGPPTSWKATCLLRVPSQQLQALRPGPLALLCRPFPSLSPNPVTKGRKGR